MSTPEDILGQDGSSPPPPLLSIRKNTAGWFVWHSFFERALTMPFPTEEKAEAALLQLLPKRELPGR